MNNVTLNFELMKYKFDQHFGDTNALGKWTNKMNEISKRGYKSSKLFNLDEIAFDALIRLANDEQVYLIKDEKHEFIKLMNQLPNKTVYMMAA